MKANQKYLKSHQCTATVRIALPRKDLKTLWVINVSASNKVLGAVDATGQGDMQMLSRQVKEKQRKINTTTTLKWCGGVPAHLKNQETLSYIGTKRVILHRPPEDSKTLFD
ncbi:hypothetical protein Tco_1058527 [Tanacetum coccineum]|uniref:Uncharacterized protein n=1 Tax=Tanacetum coccineum TaxID=301880 RepID=A0ABQ5H8H6_9ASTR